MLIKNFLIVFIILCFCFLNVWATTGPNSNDFIFIWEQAGEFTQNDLLRLSTRYNTIIIGKFHQKFNRQAQNKTARDLKAINPHVKILPYWSATRYFPADSKGAHTFDSRCILTDIHWQNFPHKNRISWSIISYELDLSQKHCVDWSISNAVRLWNRSFYDWVFLDTANPIAVVENSSDFRWRVDWIDRLGQEKIDAYNSWLVVLVSEINRKLSSEKEIIYNGIAPKKWRFERNIGLLEFADGVKNESFCYDGFRAISESYRWLQSLEIINEDLNFLNNYGDSKRFLYTTNIPASLSYDDSRRVIDYCTAVFALWDPKNWNAQHNLGYNYKKIGPIIVKENIRFYDVLDGYDYHTIELENGFFQLKSQNGYILINNSSSIKEYTVESKPVRKVGKDVLEDVYLVWETIKLPSQTAIHLGYTSEINAFMSTFSIPHARVQIIEDLVISENPDKIIISNPTNQMISTKSSLWKFNDFTLESWWFFRDDRATGGTITLWWNTVITGIKR